MNQQWNCNWVFNASCENIIWLFDIPCKSHRKINLLDDSCTLLKVWVKLCTQNIHWAQGKVSLGPLLLPELREEITKISYFELTLFLVGYKNLRKIFSISHWLFQNKPRNMHPKKWKKKKKKEKILDIWESILDPWYCLFLNSYLSLLSYFGVPRDENTSAMWISTITRSHLWLQNWILYDKIPIVHPVVMG